MIELAAKKIDYRSIVKEAGRNVHAALKDRGEEDVACEKTCSLKDTAMDSQRCCGHYLRNNSPECEGCENVCSGVRKLAELYGEFEL